MLGKIISLKKNSDSNDGLFSVTSLHVFIGSDKNCDIRILKAAPQHCLITAEIGKPAVIRNLSSKDPTLLNGIPIDSTDHVLSDGDGISVLRKRFIWQYPSSLEKDPPVKSETNSTVKRRKSEPVRKVAIVHPHRTNIDVPGAEITERRNTLSELDMAKVNRKYRTIKSATFNKPWNMAKHLLHSKAHGSMTINKRKTLLKKVNLNGQKSSSWETIEETVNPTLTNKNNSTVSPQIKKTSYNAGSTKLSLSPRKMSTHLQSEKSPGSTKIAKNHGKKTSLRLSKSPTYKVGRPSTLLGKRKSISRGEKNSTSPVIKKSPASAKIAKKHDKKTSSKLSKSPTYKVGRPSASPGTKKSPASAKIEKNHNKMTPLKSSKSPTYKVGRSSASPGTKKSPASAKMKKTHNKMTPFKSSKSPTYKVGTPSASPGTKKSPASAKIAKFLNKQTPSSSSSKSPTYKVGRSSTLLGKRKSSISPRSRISGTPGTKKSPASAKIVKKFDKETPSSSESPADKVQKVVTPSFCSWKSPTSEIKNHTSQFIHDTSKKTPTAHSPLASPKVKKSLGTSSEGKYCTDSLKGRKIAGNFIQLSPPKSNTSITPLRTQSGKCSPASSGNKKIARKMSSQLFSVLHKVTSEEEKYNVSTELRPKIVSEEVNSSQRHGRSISKPNSPKTKSVGLLCTPSNKGTPSTHLKPKRGSEQALLASPKTTPKSALKPTCESKLEGKKLSSVQSLKRKLEEVCDAITNDSSKKTKLTLTKSAKKKTPSILVIKNVMPKIAMKRRLYSDILKKGMRLETKVGTSTGNKTLSAKKKKSVRFSIDVQSEKKSPITSHLTNAENKASSFLQNKNETPVRKEEIGSVKGRSHKSAVQPVNQKSIPLSSIMKPTPARHMRTSVPSVGGSKKMAIKSIDVGNFYGSVKTECDKEMDILKALDLARKTSEPKRRGSFRLKNLSTTPTYVFSNRGRRTSGTTSTKTSIINNEPSEVVVSNFDMSQVDRNSTEKALSFDVGTSSVGKSAHNSFIRSRMNVHLASKNKVRRESFRNVSNKTFKLGKRKYRSIPCTSKVSSPSLKGETVKSSPSNVAKKADRKKTPRKELLEVGKGLGSEVSPITSPTRSEKSFSTFGAGEHSKTPESNFGSPNLSWVGQSMASRHTSDENIRQPPLSSQEERSLVGNLKHSISKQELNILVKESYKIIGQFLDAKRTRQHDTSPYVFEVRNQKKTSNSVNDTSLNLSGVNQLFGSPNNGSIKITSPGFGGGNVSKSKLQVKPVVEKSTEVPDGRTTKSRQLDTSPNLVGVKELMKTPKNMNKSLNLSGVNQLFGSPNNNGSIKITSPEFGSGNMSKSKLQVTPIVETSTEVTDGRTTKSRQLDISPNLVGVKELMKTPKNMNKSLHLSGVNQLFGSPNNGSIKITSPEYGSGNMSKSKLQVTPVVETSTEVPDGRTTKSRQLDISPNLVGVKGLMKTPKNMNKSLNLSGVNQLFGSPNNGSIKITSPEFGSGNMSKSRLQVTPVVEISSEVTGSRTTRSRQHDISPNLVGVKELMKTPKNVNASLSGVNQLFGSPNKITSPEFGSGNMSKSKLQVTPVVETSTQGSGGQTIRIRQYNISPNLVGVKELIKTPKNMNKSLNISGVNQLFGSPNKITSPGFGSGNMSKSKLQVTPVVEISSEVTGIRTTRSRQHDISPNLVGVKELMKTPKNVNTSLSGVNQLFSSPNNGGIKITSPVFGGDNMSESKLESSESHSLIEASSINKSKRFSSTFHTPVVDSHHEVTEELKLCSKLSNSKRRSKNIASWLKTTINNRFHSTILNESQNNPNLDISLEMSSLVSPSDSSARKSNSFTNISEIQEMPSFGQQTNVAKVLINRNESAQKGKISKSPSYSKNDNTPFVCRGSKDLIESQNNVNSNVSGTQSNSNSSVANRDLRNSDFSTTESSNIASASFNSLSAKAGSSSRRKTRKSSDLATFSNSLKQHLTPEIQLSSSIVKVFNAVNTPESPNKLSHSLQKSYLQLTESTTPTTIHPNSSSDKIFSKPLITDSTNDSGIKTLFENAQKRSYLDVQGVKKLFEDEILTTSIKDHGTIDSNESVPGGELPSKEKVSKNRRTKTKVQPVVNKRVLRNRQIENDLVLSKEELDQPQISPVRKNKRKCVPKSASPSEPKRNNKSDIEFKSNKPSRLLPDFELQNNKLPQEGGDDTEKTPKEMLKSESIKPKPVEQKKTRQTTNSSNSIDQSLDDSVRRLRTRSIRKNLISDPAHAGRSVVTETKMTTKKSASVVSTSLSPEKVTTLQESSRLEEVPVRVLRSKAPSTSTPIEKKSSNRGAKKQKENEENQSPPTKKSRGRPLKRRSKSLTVDENNSKSSLSQEENKPLKKHLKKVQFDMNESVLLISPRRLRDGTVMRSTIEKRGHKLNEGPTLRSSSRKREGVQSSAKKSK